MKKYNFWKNIGYRHKRKDSACSLNSLRLLRQLAEIT